MRTIHTQTISDVAKIEVEPDLGDVRIRFVRHDGTAVTILARAQDYHAFDVREQTIETEITPEAKAAVEVSS